TRSGKRAVVLDETGTTRTCHVCNHVVEGGIHPSIREWNCPQCSTHHARDENASQNGLRRLLEFLRAGADIPKLPCLGPVQIIGRCDWRFHPQGWQGTPNGGANVNSMRLPEYRQRCVGRGSLPGGDSRAPETMRRFA
ncbi:zinc ribbon domain-containing protein, partial [Cupriavidus necator]|uniref:zinc ribbon domain-containing protein n=1 Tax=Cupriavidus necator TaxID=106590 RepID=UPI0039C171ED